MKKPLHYFYVSSMVLSGLAVIAWLLSLSLDFYRLPLEERFFHPEYEQLKPSGFLGHGFGIIGTIMMVGGVIAYMIRKRWSKLRRWGLLKHWLEMHIFLATIGPILVLFHTSFKFGGLVSVSFWSMVAVFASGIVGRFIYIQIPRSLDGRELSYDEIESGRKNLSKEAESLLQAKPELMRAVLLELSESFAPAGQSMLKNAWLRRRQDIGKMRKIKHLLKKDSLAEEEKRRFLATIRQEWHLGRRMSRLMLMQKLFKYWHLAHLPFAIVMIVILLVHVITAFLLGYTWIF